MTLPSQRLGSSRGLWFRRTRCEFRMALWHKLIADVQLTTVCLRSDCGDCIIHFIGGACYNSLEIEVDEELMTLQAQSLQRGEKFKESEVHSN